MISILGELQRRNVFRTAIAYLAGAWLITEVSGTLFDVFLAPEWSIRLVVIVLALGFIPALVFAWAYELTPEGIKRDSGERFSDQAASRKKERRLDALTILFIVVAVAVVFSDRWWLDGETRDNAPAAAEARSPEEAPLEPAPHTRPVSLAVLPFLNMSEDRANEYFSDGISEELISLLSQTPGLQVTSRSSAFSFKGNDIGVPAIAGQLGVTHVLEGSVRKSGHQVRITVQLIEANSDTQLWSASYDRRLDDIFAVQEEIATTVTTKLQLTLLGETPRRRKTDTRAYTAFLKARHLGSQFTPQAFEQSNALYRLALGIDPDFADAWAGLAVNHVNQTTTGHLSSTEGITAARKAAERALEIDPGNTQALAHLGIIAIRHERDLQMAAGYLQLALQLEPTNPAVLMHAATLNRTLGRMDEAIAINARVVERDPVNPASHYFLGFSYLWARRWDEAIASFNDALILSPEHVSAHYRIAQALYYKGEPGFALEEARQERRVTKRLMGLVMLNHALGRGDEADAALAELIGNHERTTSYNIAYLLAFRGETDLAFEWLDKAVRYNDSGLPQVAYQPEFETLHDDPRWLPFLESIGLAPQQLEAVKLRH